MYKECTTTYRVKSFTFNIWYSISYIWYSPYNLYSISYIWYLVLIQNYWYLVFTIQLVFNQCYIWSLVFILNYWYLVFSVCSNLFGIWANYPPLSPGGCSTPSWCSLPSPWESVSWTRSQEVHLHQKRCERHGLGPWKGRGGWEEVCQLQLPQGRPSETGRGSLRWGCRPLQKPELTKASKSPMKKRQSARLLQGSP